MLLYVTIRRVNGLWRATMFYGARSAIQLEFINLRTRAACVQWVAACWPTH